MLRVRKGAPGVGHNGVVSTPGGEAATTPFRAGFACFVGRPNAGKSTLTNALVGEKVAITSTKPQTTRHAVRGVLHRPDGQIVLVDTPGLHKPRTLLGQRLNDVVRTTWAEVDVIGLCVPANEPVGPGDRFIAAEIAEMRKAVKIAVVTKTDLVSRERLAEQLVAVSQLADFAEVVPVSAVANDQVDLLADLLLRHLPESPQLYPDGHVTDEPLDVRIAELVREAALEGVRDELPHSLAVTVEEMGPRDGRDGTDGRPPLIDIHATVYVERPSQKAIVLGHKGERMKQVGTDARRGIEKLLGSRVFLDLHVKVAKDWQRDPKQLRRLGF
jgi:GTP-binding protein Era